MKIKGSSKLPHGSMKINSFPHQAIFIALGCGWSLVSYSSVKYHVLVLFILNGSNWAASAISVIFCSFFDVFHHHLLAVSAFGADVELVDVVGLILLILVADPDVLHACLAASQVLLPSLHDSQAGFPGIVSFAHGIRAISIIVIGLAHLHIALWMDIEFL